ncbi:MAG TPA: hypothetical protein VK739_09585 [bacterium]|nr:hypothetical protein [bacterium]
MGAAGAGAAAGPGNPRSLRINWTVKDTIGGTGGGNTPDVGGAVHDVKDTLGGIGLP